MDSSILTLMTFVPAIGAAIVFMLPRKATNAIRWTSALVTAIPLALSFYILKTYDGSLLSDYGQFQYVIQLDWIPAFNIQYYMGVDGLSVTMLLLTSLISFLCIFVSWNIKEGVKGYFALFLLLECGMMGTFCSLDFFLFFVFWEVMLLPMYFLIGIWGGPRREYAAIKFFIYTLFGSALMLLAMLSFYFLAPDYAALDPANTADMQTYNSIVSEYVGTKYGENEAEVAANIFQTDKNELGHYVLKPTFDLVLLSKIGYKLIGTTWVLAFFGLFIGFAIKVPVFPFHTWLPDAHVEAPTAISVILAGVLLKMGTYGIFRISFPLLPEQTKEFAYLLAVLGVINIVYGAMCAMAQTDLKKLVAYSSVSHMGYVMLGMASLQPEGFAGALLQMFNHGTITAMLFILVGVVYDRAHHREIKGFGGLWKAMPLYGGVTAFAFFAALGLPGLSGFISEALSFLGAFKVEEFRVMVAIGVSGVVLGAAYMLWCYQRVFLGPLNEKYKDIGDINNRELATLIPLGVLVLFIGIYPMPILDMMRDSLNGLLKVIG